MPGPTDLPPNDAGGPTLAPRQGVFYSKIGFLANQDPMMLRDARATLVRSIERTARRPPALESEMEMVEAAGWKRESFVDSFFPWERTGFSCGSEVKVPATARRDKGKQSL